MKREERTAIVRQLESELKYNRFVHTMGVAYTATSLAMVYGGDMEKAEIAGLLHDCAKCMDLKKMIRVCEKAGLEISDLERNSVSLLHSKAGSVLVSEKYGYKDEDIINAVRYHTTGRPGMSLLEKIIFVADYMEPGRDVASDLPEVRHLAFNSDTIDDAVLKILFDSLVYLKSTGREIDPMTQRTYDFYKTHDEVRNYYE